MFDDLSREQIDEILQDLEARKAAGIPLRERFWMWVTFKALRKQARAWLQFYAQTGPMPLEEAAAARERCAWYRAILDADDLDALVVEDLRRRRDAA